MTSTEPLPEELVEAVALADWYCGFHPDDVASGEADRRRAEWPSDWAKSQRRARAVLAVAVPVIRAQALEDAARLVDKRCEVRFAEHGTREPDTNACYYQGRYGETLETLDEECEEIATAIRALKENRRV